MLDVEYPLNCQEGDHLLRLIHYPHSLNFSFYLRIHSFQAVAHSISFVGASSTKVVSCLILKVSLSPDVLFTAFIAKEDSDHSLGALICHPLH